MHSSRALALRSCGVVQASSSAALQVSDTVEAALREADIDHDGSIGLAGKLRDTIPHTGPAYCRLTHVVTRILLGNADV
jgi:hypothetical protein